MKIDILSDLHFDYYFAYKNGINEDLILSFYKQYFDNNSQCLIIAGDLGHFNEQNIEILRLLKKHFYKYIVCVLGNHDYYIVDQTSMNKYKGQALYRIDEMRKLINDEENMFCLNGNVVEIEGIRFGGCDSWYDGSYVPRYWKNQPKPNSIMWKNVMPFDVQFIKGIDHYEQLFNIERTKIHKVYKECDVMITHVNPSNLNRHLSPKFSQQHGNAFFSFNGHEYIKNGSMKYWIFGHTHDAIEYEYEGVRCVCHPLGSPHEDNGSKEYVKTLDMQ